MAQIHESAAKGYSGAAETYVAGRPDYPAEAGLWLRESLGLGPGKSVLDLGAGTGKFTPNLTATGARVLALEPVDAMRAQLSARLPEVEAMGGAASAIPLPDGALDAVVCAQAFHWFATPEALAEIRRVLAPGGKLGLIWNVRDERVDWVAELSRLTDAREGDTPRFKSGAWRKLFPAPGLLATDAREAVNHHIGPASQVILDRTLSVSFIAALGADEKAKVAAEVQALIDRTPALSDKPEVAFPYVTTMLTFEKRPL